MHSWCTNIRHMQSTNFNSKSGTGDGFAFRLFVHRLTVRTHLDAHGSGRHSFAAFRCDGKLGKIRTPGNPNFQSPSLSHSRHGSETPLFAVLIRFNQHFRGHNVFPFYIDYFSLRFFHASRSHFSLNLRLTIARRNVINDFPSNSFL